MITIIILFCVFLYLYGTRNFSYWKNKGVVYETPHIFFGSLLKQYTENVSISERYANLYKKYPDEKYVGFFEGNQPALLIRDPDIIKYVMLFDFKQFHERGIIPGDNDTEPLLNNIIFMDGDVWKLLRTKLTPFFSVKKLKIIFPLIEERAERLLKVTEQLAEVKDEIDVNELLAKYTTDIIGACCFGVDTDALNQDSSFFRRIGKRVFKPTIRDVFVAILKRTAPKLTRNLHYFEAELQNEILSFIFSIMSQRNQEPSGRNDFIDFILELKKAGNLIGESIEKSEKNGSPAVKEIELSDSLLAAQVFGFFGAGFETSTFASSIFLHTLAFNPEEQARCYKDIDGALKKYNGKLCYDAVRDMKYLEMAFRESCRLQPSPGFIIRKSAKKYTFPNTNLTIDKDVRIIISTAGLHVDGQHFNKPQEFRPERFSPSNIGTINKNVYLPFGNGPRACIGERLAIMQSLAGVATILRKFIVSPSKNTVREPRIDPTSTIVQSVQNGLPLKLSLREKKR